jgi:hypothetical protein
MGQQGRRRVESEYEVRRSAVDLRRVMREFGALPLPGPAA